MFRVVLVLLAAATPLLSGSGVVAAGTAGSGIYAYSVDDATPPLRLTGSAGFNGYPAVSPNGTHR